MKWIQLNSKKKNVRMIAHRGLSGLETENTNAAFVAAGNRSYFGIETDVHVTSDGKFVIIHDYNTERVSGENYDVERTDYATLKKLKLYDIQQGVNKSGLMRSDFVIPDLEDYISICKKYGKTTVLELKNDMGKDHISEIIECIKKLGYLDKTIFISFKWNNLICVKEYFSEAEVQFLVDKCDEELIKLLFESHIDIDIFYEVLSKELVDKLHSNGIKINCWTVDSPEEALRMAEFGVDFITSNILE